MVILNCDEITMNREGKPDTDTAQKQKFAPFRITVKPSLKDAPIFDIDNDRQEHKFRVRRLVTIKKDQSNEGKEGGGIGKARVVKEVRGEARLEKDNDRGVDMLRVKEGGSGVDMVQGKEGGGIGKARVVKDVGGGIEARLEKDNDHGVDMLRAKEGGIGVDMLRVKGGGGGIDTRKVEEGGSVDTLIVKEEGGGVDMVRVKGSGGGGGDVRKVTVGGGGVDTPRVKDGGGVTDTAKVEGGDNSKDVVENKAVENSDAGKEVDVKVEERRSVERKHHKKHKKHEKSEKNKKNKKEKKDRSEEEGMHEEKRHKKHRRERRSRSRKRSRSRSSNSPAQKRREKDTSRQRSHDRQGRQEWRYSPSRFDSRRRSHSRSRSPHLARNRISRDKSPETDSLRRRTLPVTTSPKSTLTPKTKKEKSPRTKSPGAKSPKARSPRAKSPRTKSPGAKSPRIKSPRAKSPRAKSPQERSPREKFPREKFPREKSPKKKSSREKSPREKSPRTKSSREKFPREKSPGEQPRRRKSSGKRKSTSPSSSSKPESDTSSSVVKARVHGPSGESLKVPSARGNPPANIDLSLPSPKRSRHKSPLRSPRISPHKSPSKSSQKSLQKSPYKSPRISPHKSPHKSPRNTSNDLLPPDSVVVPCVLEEDRISVSANDTVDDLKAESEPSVKILEDTPNDAPITITSIASSEKKKKTKLKKKAKKANVEKKKKKKSAAGKAAIVDLDRNSDDELEDLLFTKTNKETKFEAVFHDSDVVSAKHHLRIAVVDLDPVRTAREEPGKNLKKPVIARNEEPARSEKPAKKEKPVKIEEPAKIDEPAKIEEPICQEISPAVSPNANDASDAYEPEDPTETPASNEFPPLQPPPAPPIMPGFLPTIPFLTGAEQQEEEETNEDEQPLVENNAGDAAYSPIENPILGLDYDSSPENPSTVHLSDISTRGSTVENAVGIITPAEKVEDFLDRIPGSFMHDTSEVVDMDMSSPTNGMRASSPENDDDIIEQLHKEFVRAQNAEETSQRFGTDGGDTWGGDVYDPGATSPLGDVAEDPAVLAYGLSDDFDTMMEMHKRKQKKKHRHKKDKKQLPLAKEKRDIEEALNRVHRQARVEDEMKHVLKTYFKHKDITKEEYKMILRKAVPQVANSNHGIDPERIRSLVKKYVAKYKGQRLRHRHAPVDKSLIKDVYSPPESQELQITFSP